MFTQDQLAQLTRKLDPKNVKQRKGSDGKTVSYVEGWYVNDLANEIFGFGNWDIETVEMRREHEPVHIPSTEDKPKGSIVVTYSAKVRVTVWSQDGARSITRERTGAHRGFATTVGEAIENCMKAAETDATKRAFTTFGNVFGLALYDKSQKNVGTDDPAPNPRVNAHRHPIEVGFGDDADTKPAPSISQRAIAGSGSPRPLQGEVQRANGMPY